MAARFRYGARLASLLLGLTGCGGTTDLVPPDSGGDVWFEDVTDRSGVDFRHLAGNERRFWFPEIMGGGGGFGDVDGDGRLDLYLVQSGDLQEGPGPSSANALYRNLGAGEFEDVTATSGAGDRGYGMGCGFGDADEDGDLDLYVTNLGPNVLYTNDGAGRFADATLQAGVGDGHWGTSCAFLDYDTDGDLDLFVVNYLNWSADRELECSSAYSPRDYCAPTNYSAPATDVLYRNDGGLRFQDVTEDLGLQRAFGNGLGVATGDFDGDGLMDVYVANDQMPNQLWRRQPGGAFRDDALLAGCAVDHDGRAEAGMGVLGLDVEHDGDLDLFMTHLRGESNTFYLNAGGFFVDHTVMLGLGSPSLLFTGFGVVSADFDLDGRLDLYVANGRVTFGRPLFHADDPFAEPNQLFRGVEGGGFQEVRGRDGLRTTSARTSRGLVLGDYDDDGDLDLAVVNNGSSFQLLENVRERAGHWLQLRVLTGSGRDAYGARVSVGQGEERRWRQVQAGYGYCTSNDPRVHFGLGARTDPTSVTVVWVDGSRESFGLLDVDRMHTLRRGEGTTR